MVWILQWNFCCVWRSTEFERLSPNGPIGICIIIAVGDAAKVVDIGIEIPVAGDIIE